MKSKYPKASKIPIIWDHSCKTHSESDWKSTLSNQWSKTKKRSLDQAIRLLALHTPPQWHPLAAPNQPFDRHLLALSPLYLKSRKLFIQNQGAYRPCLNSSPRTLSSLALLESIIEYSPVEKEYIWAATNPIQRRNPAHLFQIRNLISNLFHEQNHRILWKILPNAPKKKESVRRYLNFAESLVIAADMALSDEVGQTLGSLLHLCGAIYDLGTELRPAPTQNTKRQYRNYLHACVYATYLYLELYQPKEILQATQARFNDVNPIGTLAAERSLRLDLDFVKKTNPFWQRSHWKEVATRLQTKQGDPLELSDDPMNPYLHYLWAEKWFEFMGL